MKTFLIATDFSEASRNASRYGVAMARVFNAKIVLFSAYHEVPIPVTESSLIMASDDMKNITSSLLDKELKELVPAREIPAEANCRMGQSSDSILKVAAEHKADLIIVGVKSGGKASRKIFGSVTASLVKKTDLPVIVVPEHAKFAPVDIIAIANESDLPSETNKNLLYSLRYIAERFHSKVYIVRVFDDRFREAYEWHEHPRKLENMIRCLDPEYTRITGDDVTVSLNKFIKIKNVNLLAVLSRKHSLVEKLLGKNTLDSVISGSDIPLLVIPENKPSMRKRISLKQNRNVDASEFQYFAK